MHNLLAAADTALAGWLPPLLRIALWAVVSASISMAVYAKLSPQQKLLSLKASQQDARRALMDYKGDFAGLFPLIKRDLGLSFYQLAAVIPGVVLATAPLVWLMLTLSELAGDQAYSSFGPDWMRGFDFWYIAIAVACSLVIKIVFRIA